MARRKRRLLTNPSASPIVIGNCKVEIEGAGSARRENEADSVTISFSDAAKIKISVDRSGNSTKHEDGHAGGRLDENGEDTVHSEDYSIFLVNPKDMGSDNDFFLQEILEVYKRELPSMNFAANTGKKSQFLERCVSNGKYKTLVLRMSPISKLGEVTCMKKMETSGNALRTVLNGFGKPKFGNVIGSMDIVPGDCIIKFPGEVIAAFSFQIVPSVTQFAEIPVAAVNTTYQNRGFGHYLFEELKRRLQHVGVSTIICWADKESEGFWLKQGFKSVGNVDSKGRGRKLPIKAEIRRALCFPGGSTLMVAHISKSVVPVSFTEQTAQKKICPVESKHLEIKELCTTSGTNSTEKKKTGKAVLFGIPTEGNPADERLDVLPSGSKTGLKSPIALGNLHDQIDSTDKHGENKIISAGHANCSCFDQCAKKRVWESSVYSLKSKRVKGSFCDHHSSHVNRELSGSPDRDKLSSEELNLRAGSRTLVEATFENPLIQSTEEQAEGSMLNKRAHHQSVHELSGGAYPTVMFMDIADENKKMKLTKIVENLGGSVTGSGGVSTHVITRKARRTLNFCIALCSGALVVSSEWLRESYKEGKFLDGLQFLLKDVDYALKYKSPLKEAVLKAKARPHALLKGCQICIAKHVRPPSGILSQIIISAGGTVIRELDEMKEPTKTIFLASEEDMEEAFAAAEEGVWTFSSEWFMNCVMKQELDFEAPQFAESL